MSIVRGVSVIGTEMERCWSVWCEVILQIVHYAAPSVLVLHGPESPGQPPSLLLLSPGVPETQSPARFLLCHIVLMLRFLRVCVSECVYECMYVCESVYVHACV